MHSNNQIINNNNNKMKDSSKQLYNKNYVNCILQNKNLIDPVMSCQFGSNNHKQLGKSDHSGMKRYREEFRGKSQHNLNLINLKTQKIQPKKIFDRHWKMSNPDIRNSTALNEKDQVIDMFLKKNQEIAASLMKEKKSMSDYVYNTGKKNQKIYRYLEMKSSVPFDEKQSIRYKQKKTEKQQQSPKQLKQNEPSKQIRENTINLPKIRKVFALNYQRQQQSQQNQGSIFNSQENDRQKLIQVTEKQQKQSKDNSNICIEKFLKLKQQAYIKNSHYDGLKLKKKVQSTKKKVSKKKEQVKNSLQDFLEAKIIPKQASYHPALQENGKATNQRQVLKILERIRNSKYQQNYQLKQEINKVKQQPKIIPEKTLSPVKKKISIGLKTKFSQKYLFADGESSVYDNKIKLYRQFLFLMNLAHNVFDPLVLDDLNSKIEIRYKYYVGRGNNKELVRALMKRRYWWVEVDDPIEANFVWTQLKMNNYYSLQNKTERVSAFFYEQKQQKTQKEKLEKKKKNSAQKNKKQASPTKKLPLYKAPFPVNSIDKVATPAQKQSYQSFIKQANLAINPDKYHNFENRKKLFPTNTFKDIENKINQRIHNHLQNNFYIGNKKALFSNLKRYYNKIGKDIFSIVPLTFHINEEGINDPTFKQFTKYFKENKKNKNCKNIWIIKPGENSNRGNGITVCSGIGEISREIGVGKKHKQGPHTYIIQKYIEKPMLYKGRKFDIRHYMLATKIHGKARLYWYSEGYVRTSSRDFDLEEIEDVEVHLTNDAIQKYATSYGKFQQGNKISYAELQKYFDANYPNRKFSLANQLYPKMKSISLDAFKSAYLNIDPHNLQHNFEIFGLDFMIDANFNVWLIQVNTNPCLEINSNLLSRIVPNMLQNSLRLTIDPLFPPYKHYPNTLKHFVPDNPLDRLQYQLIFDQSRDGKELQQIFRDEQENKQLENLEEDQDTFDNDGNEGDFNIQ